MSLGKDAAAAIEVEFRRLSPGLADVPDAAGELTVLDTLGMRAEFVPLRKTPPVAGKEPSGRQAETPFAAATLRHYGGRYPVRDWLRSAAGCGA